MKRLALFALAGALLGGVIHIVIIFLMPNFASREAWGTMARFGPEMRFNLIPQVVAGAEPLPALDPFFAHAVCRFSLKTGMARMRAELPSDFWSVSIFDRRGRSVYSLNDRSAERGVVDIVVIQPEQLAELRSAPPASMETAIVIEAPIESGFALLRVFVPDRAYVPRANAALSAARCVNEPVSDPRG